MGKMAPGGFFSHPKWTPNPTPAPTTLPPTTMAPTEPQWTQVTNKRCTFDPDWVWGDLGNYDFGATTKEEMCQGMCQALGSKCAELNPQNNGCECGVQPTHSVAAPSGTSGWSVFVQ